MGEWGSRTAVLDLNGLMAQASCLLCSECYLDQCKANVGCKEFLPFTYDRMPQGFCCEGLERVSRGVDDGT